MAFNPIAILQERQCAPIYDDLDTGRNSNAVQQCDKLLSQQPNLHLASSLKALALCRMNKKREANVVVDKLIEIKIDSFNNSILSPLCMALQSLDRDLDEATLLDNFSKTQTNQTEWGRKACLAMIRTYQWQRVQQTALRIHKSSSTKKGSDDLYFWWSMQAYCLIADDPSLPGYQLALTLAHRMISKQLETNPFGPNSDEVLFLFANILQKEGGQNLSEALKILSEDEIGKSLCERSMTLAALRFELRKKVGQWDVINAESIKALEDGLRNWQAVEAAIESALALSEKTTKPSAIIFVEEKLMKMARQGKRDRTVRLAPLLLLKMATEKQKQSSLKAVNLVQLISAYYDDFKGKACASEDLEPYLILATEQEKQTILQKLESERTDSSISSLDGFYATLNNAKLRRALQSTTEVNATSEVELALHYAQQYLQSLPLSKDLPKTEMQPGDDFALLTVEALINASSIQRKNEEEGWFSTIVLAITFLKVILQYSPKAYKLRILLVRILQQFGCIEEARKHFDALGVKAIQFDTLGWILAHRFAHSTLLLTPSSDQEKSWLLFMRHMRTVWYEGKNQVPEMVCKSMEHGTFSRVEEMILFGKKLTNSICRRLHTIEGMRLKMMDIDFAVDEGILKRELEEKGTEFHDQRDKQVIPTLLPPQSESIISQTEPILSAPEPGSSYVRSMVGVLSDSAPSFGNEAAGDALSPDEIAMCKIAKALKEKDENTSSLVLDEFEKIVKRCQSSSSNSTKEMPSTMLHSACVALEVFHLIKSRGQEDISEKVAQGLRRTSEVLGQYKSHSKIHDLSNAWEEVLQKLLSLNGKEKEVPPSKCIQQTMEELSKGTQIAINSLLSRMNAIL